MTQIKEKAFEMIARLPDEKMKYVVNILENIEELSMADQKKKNKTEAFETLLEFHKTLSNDFDDVKELENARDEKYASIS